MKITNLSAQEILASYGSKTIEATIELDGHISDSASIPAGISAGQFEVKKVSTTVALEQINALKPNLIGPDWTQATLDHYLESQDLGGNTQLAISAAFWKAGRKIFVPQKRESFPKLLVLMFEGGEHGNSNLSIQEFLVVEESIEQAIRDFRSIKEHLEQNLVERTVGAEGGFSPVTYKNLDALNTIKEVLPNRKIALDVAGVFQTEDLNYKSLLETYPIISIEDPYGDQDWVKWKKFNQDFGSRIMVVGDDLTTTNPTRISQAIEFQAINAIIIKPNQIGTISSTVEAVQTARDGGLKIIVSHRGEDTDDDWIVDFALFVNADYVKFGGMDRGERIAKYNRLIELGMR